MSVDRLDRERLEVLVAMRDKAALESALPLSQLMGKERPPFARYAYFQGCIDTHCGQNAIEQADVPNLELRLSPEVSR